MEIIKNENDFYTSVERALDEIDKTWRDLPGLLIVGSHMPSDVEAKIAAIKKARESGTPFLGICFGMQLMAIEYARGTFKDATSEEIGEGTHVITKLPRLHVGLDKVAGWWGTTDESHWHNYAVNSTQWPNLFKDDWDISASDGIVEIMRYKKAEFFVGVQFHPEYNSFKDKFHPVLVDFLDACRK